MAKIERMTGTGNRKAGDLYRVTAGETVLTAQFIGKRGGHDVWDLQTTGEAHVGSLVDYADTVEQERVSAALAAAAAKVETTHTRESWLHAAIEVFRPRFAEVGLPLPEKIHVSVGFGGAARAESKAVLGVCWSRSASADGVNHLFISPVLDDTARVLDVLLHELIHAADDCQSGHKGAFAEAATRLGLTGKMTATTAGVDLAAEMICLAETLGAYPHGRFTAFDTVPATVPVGPGGETAPAPRPSSGPRKQSTRMLKVECPCCGYVVRTTAKWLEMGTPLCPGGTQMMAV